MPFLSDNPMWEAFGARTMLWAVHRAAEVGECVATVRRVGDDGSVDDWHREWRDTAERLEGIAADCASRGHRVSAREAYLRASAYHRASYWPLYGSPVDPRLAESFACESDAFARAAALMDPPVRALEIPFGDTSLPAWLAVPAEDGARRPTIVHVNGYDSTIHEGFLAHGPAALARGYNHVCFDGPGQGRALIRDGLAIRPDWEAVVVPVIDQVLALPQVDPERVVLTGWSFGGFLAPRAAAFEHRIAALVADPGQWDQRQAVVSSLPLDAEQRVRFPDVDPEVLAPMQAWLEGPDADPMLRWRLLQRGPWVHGADSLLDYLADLCRYEISPVAGKISCPTLVTAADDDPIAGGAQALHDALNVPSRLVRFTAAEGAGGHCEQTARALYEQRVFDWLDEVLAD
jgi:pimeloyl-ACP methyl ester carboxylesterase